MTTLLPEHERERQTIFKSWDDEERVKRREGRSVKELSKHIEQLIAFDMRAMERDKLRKREQRKGTR